MRSRTQPQRRYLRSDTGPCNRHTQYRRTGGKYARLMILADYNNRNAPTLNT
jgi:hypothetical protein